MYRCIQITLVPCASDLHIRPILPLSYLVRAVSSSRHELEKIPYRKANTSAVLSVPMSSRSHSLHQAMSPAWASPAVHIKCLVCFPLEGHINYIPACFPFLCSALFFSSTFLEWLFFPFRCAWIKRRAHLLPLLCSLFAEASGSMLVRQRRAERLNRHRTCVSCVGIFHPVHSFAF